MATILIIGGARSGKSRFAQELEEVIIGNYPVIDMAAIEGKLA